MITISIAKDYTFDDIRDNCWCGAINLVEDVAKAGKRKEFMELLSEFSESCAGVLTETALNNLLWFDSEWIYDYLEIPFDRTGMDDEEEENE